MGAGSVLAWFGIALAAVGALFVLGFIYLAIVLAWEEERTKEGAYYNLPLAERRQFRRWLRFHASVLLPVVRLGARLTSVTLPKASFRFEGVPGPKGSCSEESFKSGSAYKAGPEDIFVVTQMKCGTTWMQHLVYQVLTRGRGELAEKGEALYAISPWLEGTKSVQVSTAPLIGEGRPSRIIKTHFGADMCPISSQARYVYVARHPVSCFASCADFITENLGAFAPDLDAIQDWFCSEDDMWWGSWPRHVDGWWKLARARDNVLFVRFEDMKQDLESVARSLAAFLDMDPLQNDELAAIVTKCSFEYMQGHADSFEMQPPHLLAVEAELLVKGTADRYRDVPVGVRKEIMDWCAARLASGDFPLDREYPAT